MRVFYTDVFELPLPAGHRFPMTKYPDLRRRLVAEGVIGASQLLIPQAATDDQLRRVHTRQYLDDVVLGRLDRAAVRRMGFPWSEQLVERSRRSTGATVAACRSALNSGVAVNLAGGTHHAFADHGAGYCVFNDAAVAARCMQLEGRAARVMVVDCDVHQGDGTAAIFAGDSTVFTFSIHGARNYPFHKQTSDLDVPLPDGTGDDAYMAALAEGLEQATARARPQLAIYLAGADPYHADRLGRLALSKNGLSRRDQHVLGTLTDRGVAVAVVMAGGYGAVSDLVDIHCVTVAAAVECSQHVAIGC